MTVSMEEWVLSLSLWELGDYLMDHSGKREFERRVRDHLYGAPHKSSPGQQTPQGLQDYADVYGEQVTNDAVADIAKYFRHYHIPGVTVGGLQTGLSSLGVAATHVKCNYSALASLGEALAGWYFERKGWMPLARPIVWPTDIVFMRAGEARMECALVQVKSTQPTTVRENLKNGMAAAAVKHADHVQRVQQADQHTAWRCHVVGVVAKAGGDFEILDLWLLW